MRKLIWLSLLLPCLLGFLPSLALAANCSQERFGCGKKYMGFQVGYGSGFSLGFSGNGDGHEVEYVAAFPSLGVGISDLKWDNDWYRGSFDLVVEGEFIKSFEPRDGFSAGMTLLARYNFLTWMRFVPYAEAGAGVGYLDFNLMDQEDGFIFYPQVGLGFQYFLTGRMAVNTSIRLHHISNAGTNMPNNGITSGLVLAGFTFFLD
jgi:opacity protein-like surface antigen